MVEVNDIDINTIRDWLGKNEVFLLDVREKDEWEQMRIPGAFLLPCSDFDPTQIPNHTEKRLVILCHVGGRSAQIAHHLIACGHSNPVYNMVGGIKAWAEAGCPVEIGPR